MEERKSRSDRKPELSMDTPLNPEMMVGVGQQRYMEETYERKVEDSNEDTDHSSL